VEASPAPENISTVEETPMAKPTLTPQVNKPAKVDPISPQGLIQSAQPAFVWQTVSGAERYQIRVNSALQTTILEQWLAAADICAQDQCKLMPRLSLVEGIYIWQVRAGNAAGEGEWSPELNFTVSGLPAPPAAATPVSPSGSLPANLTTPIFAWSGVYEASGYRLVLQKADGGLIFDQWMEAGEVCSGITCQVTPALALVAGDYQWQVQTRNDGGDGPPSAWLQFNLKP